MTPSFRVCPLAVILAGCAHAFVAGNSRGIDAAYDKRPLTFESLGPAAGGQRFITRVSGRTIGFTASGEVTEQRPGSYRPETVLRFAGARPNIQPEPVGPPSGTANYLTGSRPERWRTGVPLFSNIEYRNVYPGIDLIYYGNEKRLEYDLVVAPRASWGCIRLAFGGVKNLEIGPEGNLRLQTRSGWVVHDRPVVYQRAGHGRRRILGRYVRKGGNEVGFEIGVHDPSLPIIIDPTLTFSSYLGGSGDDYGHAVAVDGSGYVYVAGETGSVDFPMHGPEQATMAGDTDVFVTKWNPAGTGLVYSTYIGGSNRDAALGVAVDSSSNVYVTGFTDSADFPTTKGAFRTNFMGDTKAFVVKLNPAGNALIYATFLGGSGDDTGTAIAVDNAGEAHIAGYTASVDFPTTAGAFQICYGGGSSDGFVAKLNAAGSGLVFASYLGGLENDTAAGVALDPAGNIYVTGQTQSANFPTLSPLQPTSNESDAFVVKMTTSGQTVYSTYLGGTGLTNGTAIAADVAGNAYVTGSTDAPDFPVTVNAYQSTNNGSYEVFIATLNPYGSSILGATYLGGSGSDSGYGIALDSSGNIYIAGTTNSIDFPVFDATQPTYNGGGDAFIAALNNRLTGLIYATYFGGSANDSASAIAVDSAGDAYITGWTNSAESSVGFPVTTGAFQTMGIGGIDAFIAKLAVGGAPLVCSTSSQPMTVQAGSASQLVGDLLMSCTGGTTAAPVAANILVALNVPISGSQPELFAGSGTVPLSGVPNGNGGVSFQGISFAAPGPSATVPLRVTNIWANTGSMGPGGPIDMTVAVQNANPSLTVAPAKQTVANTAIPPTPRIQQVVLTKATPSGNCVAPTPGHSFLTSDAAVSVWFLASNASAGDVVRLDWSTPLGGIYQSHTLAAAGGVTECLSDAMNIAGAAQSMAGTWTVKIYWNGSLLTSAVFVVLTAGANELIWQDTAAGQVTKHCFSGPAYTGWAWLNPTGNPGWTLVAAADMNGDGVPDLIWQNNTTRQVTVNYYGGNGGSTMTGWAWLNAAGNPGWTVVAAADMNGDGVPDLIWQNDTTRQVTVNYYGGNGGASMTGWAWLNAAGNPGWTVVAAADMNGDGVPDLIWQNDATRQVTVNYYGGNGGVSMTGWAWLNASGNPGWSVVGTGDFNGDGVPDLVWQNNSTGQVTVNYYGGAQGTTLQGWAWLEPAGYPGWRTLVTP